MRNRLFLLLLSLWCPALVSGAAPLPALELQVPIRADVAAYQYRLDNGLTVVLVPNARAPLSAVYHWVRVGSLQESTGATGIAHLFEHMMFRPLSAGAPGFFELAERLGAEVNAETRFNATVYTSVVPTRNLRALLGMESARFKGLRVTDALLDVERNAVASEYSTKFDASPVTDLWFQIYQAAFPGHPYGRTMIGDRADLPAIRAEHCNAFFEAFYKARNTGLFVGGNFDRDEVLGWIVELYGDWAPGQPTVLPAAYRHDGKPVFARGRLPSGVPYVMAGFRTPELDGRNHDLQNIVNHVLFGSDHSLAQRRLLDRDKLVSAVAEFNYDYDRAMLKTVMILLPETSREQAVAALLRLPQDFRALSDEEYQAYLKEFQVGTAEYVLRNENLIEALSFHWGKYGDIRHVADRAKRPLAVGKAQVAAFLDRYVTESNLVVVENKE